MFQDQDGAVEGCDGPSSTAAAHDQQHTTAAALSGPVSHGPRLDEDSDDDSVSGRTLGTSDQLRRDTSGVLDTPAKGNQDQRKQQQHVLSVHSDSDPSLDARQRLSGDGCPTMGAGSAGALHMHRSSSIGPVMQPAFCKSYVLSAAGSPVLKITLQVGRYSMCMSNLV